MGKKRRKRRESPLQQQGEVEYFYPVSNPSESNNQNKLAKRKLHQEPFKNRPLNKTNSSANIKDNVGMTVIMPGGIY
jgi:hypothetical protein